MTRSIRIDDKHSLQETARVALKHVLPGLAGEVRCTFNKKHQACLSGIVSSYYEKQVAQEVLMRIPEIDSILNELKVSRN